ncbi:MAG: glycoside hydrolase family 3 C-terminal domain-containing protein [Gemmatimonadetes bacterium]|nr:glycoside hydrolase family 3 C-terminal domain-containing protein [Gemmatimonadota bacterium]
MIRREHGSPVAWRLRLVILALLLPARLAAQNVDSRVESLIHAMTLEEKVSLLHGARDPDGEGQAGYMPGIPRLGIPPLRLSDGPAGVRTRLPATALPAPVALAASFDPALARRYGTTIGREGRARNQDVMLAPMVNIVRVPQAGRNFETLGEDPFLAARMVEQEVEGMQGAGAIATVKHYVANNFEDARTSVSADLDERALHEIYLPGFEAAVAAGAGAVMCSYNQVNGAFACDNPEVLTRILRDQLGFPGWVMTDWGARHSADALAAGLDQEMPGGSGSSRQPVWFGDSLVAAVQDGRTPEALVDRSVRRILRQMDRFGLLDGSAPPRPTIDSVADADVARDVALAGTVLLRNRDQVLPLSPSDLGSVVVIGPTAARPVVGGGGSSHVLPLAADGTLPALRRRAPVGTKVRYEPGIDLDGVPVPASALGHPGAQGGLPGLLRAEDGVEARTDDRIDFTGADALPGGQQRSWTGTLTAPTSGVYEIKLQVRGARANLTLNGERFLGGFGGSLLSTADSLSNASRTIRLESGVAHAVTLDVESGGGGQGDAGVQVRLAWVTPERRQALVDDAVAAARDARTAVVFAYNEGSEGRDRTTLALPGTQDALVEAVTRANPRTVVVLQTGDPVLMPWIDDVAAVMETWYAGEAGGDATAALLLGEAAPGGKLPVTFPRTESASPTADSTRYPGRDGHAEYSEGIFVGYRWYDTQGVEPLFPFGHGLSYTTFAYDGLVARPSGDGIDVTFTLHNTGPRAGSEVAQVYLGPVDDPPVPMARKSLAAFQRVMLAAGESRQLTLHLDARALSYWSEGDGGWRRVPGTRQVMVGSSSGDIRLTGSVDLTSSPGG